MPRLTKSLPKYCKHKASGQAVVTIDAKDFYLGPHGGKASKLEYDRLVSEWLQNGRRLPQDSESELTVTELVAVYWRHAKNYYVKNGRPTDELACIRVALRHLRESYGHVKVSEFGPLALKVVREKMVDAGNSRGYVNKNVGRIKRVFRWGVEQELVPATTHQALTAVSGLRRGRTTARETAPVLPVDDTIVEATLRYAPNDVADMVRFQKLTGCRPGELCGLRPRDIDQASEIWTYRPFGHKMEHTSQVRLISIGPQAQSVLGRHLPNDPDEYCFRPRRSPLGRYTTDSYRDAIHRACERAFPPPAELSVEELRTWRKTHRWNPNQLRHSAATKIRERFGLEAAQVTLGHANANVTQVYAERDRTLAARVMKEVG